MLLPLPQLQLQPCPFPFQQLLTLLRGTPLLPQFLTQDKQGLESPSLPTPVTPIIERPIHIEEDSSYQPLQSQLGYQVASLALGAYQVFILALGGYQVASLAMGGYQVASLALDLLQISLLGYLDLSLFITFSLFSTSLPQSQ